MLRIYKLSKEAITYIKQSLRDGDTLASYLSDLQLEGGEVTTCLPNGVSSEAILQFNTGGVVGKGHTMKHLVTQIREYLGKKREHLAIFETLARPGDPSLLSPKSSFFSHNNEVYYFVTPRSSKSEILHSVQFARSYPFIGVLSSLSPENQDIQVGQEVDGSTLRDLALRCQYLLVGAYDDEAVLVWKKQ